MELEAAKMIGAGLAAIALAGAGVGIGIIFGNYLSDFLVGNYFWDNVFSFI
jgi:F-type H+-transporting ATPase subunit c